MLRSFFGKFSSTQIAKEAATHALSEHERQLIDLCACHANRSLQTLKSNPHGLSADEAADRLDEHGRNEISYTRSLSFWSDIYRRCRSPLVVQLLVIAAVSALIGEFKSTLIVSGMIALSVGLSYVLDRRSSKAVEALGKRVQSHALLLRDGKEVDVPLAEVVPGDIVVLHAGSVIPADLRLLTAKDFLSASRF
jgi:Mg2+-importing ATPase